MNALLLSAGLGSRFRPITDHIAKPAIPFLNIPLLGYALHHLEQLPLTNLVINTHHLPKTIELAAKFLTENQKYKLHFSHEPKILGSGGGIKKAQALLASTEDFIVCNADQVVLFDHEKSFAPLIEFHKSRGALATLLTTEHPDAGRALGGVWSDDKGNIVKLGGQGSEPNAKHFASAYVFSPRIFDYMPQGEFHIFKDCLHKAMAKNEKVITFHDPSLTWLDISSEKDYIFSTKIALDLLFEGKTKSKNLVKILNRFKQNFEKIAPSQWLYPGAKFMGTLEKNSYLFMGINSEIGPDVVIKGFAVMGPDSKFVQGVIENSVIAAGVHVNPITTLRDEIVF